MNLRDAVAEAVAAFDAANHAFGRFVTYVVRPHNEPVPAAVQQVREALQDAALSVPAEPTEEAVGEFLAALRMARERVVAFLAMPPAGYALEEAITVPAALDEAIGVLEGLPPTSPE